MYVLYQFHSDKSGLVDYKLTTRWNNLKGDLKGIKMNSQRTIGNIHFHFYK